MRVGHIDAVAHRYAVEAAGGVDGIADAPRLGGAYDWTDRLSPATPGDLTSAARSRSPGRS
jgi:adenylosuccinate synthase